eukprot:SAG31_NODE_2392_length_5797_cov_6.901369_2_plen_248_part_00
MSDAILHPSMAESTAPPSNSSMDAKGIPKSFRLPSIAAPSRTSANACRAMPMPCARWFSQAASWQAEHKEIGNHNKKKSRERFRLTFNRSVSNENDAKFTPWSEAAPLQQLGTARSHQLPLHHQKRSKARHTIITSSESKVQPRRLKVNTVGEGNMLTIENVLDHHKSMLEEKIGLRVEPLRCTISWQQRWPVGSEHLDDALVLGSHLILLHGCCMMLPRLQLSDGGAGELAVRPGQDRQLCSAVAA